MPNEGRLAYIFSRRGPDDNSTILMGRVARRQC